MAEAEQDKGQTTVCLNSTDSRHAGALPHLLQHVAVVLAIVAQHLQLGCYLAGSCMLACHRLGIANVALKACHRGLALVCCLV